MTEPENEMDIIFHNMNVTSNFRTVRMPRYRTVSEQLGILYAFVQAGCFDKVVSVAASLHSFVAVVETTLSMEELKSRGFPA